MGRCSRIELRPCHIDLRKLWLGDRGNEDLRGADLRRANLTHADLRSADLSHAELSNAYGGQKLAADHARFDHADLSGVELQDASFRAASMRHVRLTGANLQGAVMSDADLTGADLTGANLIGSDLSRTCLVGANLTDADLRGTKLRDARLAPLVTANAVDSYGTTPELAPRLRRANLFAVSLAGIDLEHADLVDADLRNADLRDANLFAANLAGAKLHNADLRGANLNGTVGLSRSALAGADLRGAKLPEQLDHSVQVESATLAVKQCRVYFGTLLALCSYCVVSAWNTEQITLLLNDGSMSLPVLGIEVSTLGFYLFAPLAIVAIFVYYALFLQRTWERLAALPRWFVDGTHVDERVHPWFPATAMSSFWALRDPHTRWAWLAHVIAFAALYGFPLATVVLLWGHVQVLHDRSVSEVYGILLAVVGVFGVERAFYARRTLRRADPVDPRWAVGVVIALFAMLAVVRAIVKPGVESRLYRPYLVIADEDLAGAGRTKFRNRDLSYATITRSDLHGADFQAARLLGADLSGSNLAGVDFAGSELVGASLRYAQLHGARLRDADLLDADFHESILDGVDLSSSGTRARPSFPKSVFLRVPDERWEMLTSSLRSTSFAHGRLTDTHFSGQRLQDVVFWRATLENVSFAGVRLEGVSFADATLDGVDFRRAELVDVSFAGASITGSDFFGAQLRDVDFSEATILDSGFENSRFTYSPAFEPRRRNRKRVNGGFSRADIADADFSRADLEGVRFFQTRIVYSNFTESMFRGGVSFENCALAGLEFAFANFDSVSIKGTQCVRLAFFDTLVEGVFRSREDECGSRSVLFDRASLGSAELNYSENVGAFMGVSVMAGGVVCPDSVFLECRGVAPGERLSAAELWPPFPEGELLRDIRAQSELRALEEAFSALPEEQRDGAGR